MSQPTLAVPEADAVQVTLAATQQPAPPATTSRASQRGSLVRQLSSLKQSFVQQRRASQQRGSLSSPRPLAALAAGICAMEWISNLVTPRGSEGDGEAAPAPATDDDRLSPTPHIRGSVTARAHKPPAGLPPGLPPAAADADDDLSSDPDDESRSQVPTQAFNRIFAGFW